MNGWGQLAVSNAVVAALAAVVVMGITRIWRNPHLAHVLWALVIVKLITPPLVFVPIPVFFAAPLPHEVVTPATSAAPAEADVGAAGSDSLGAGIALGDEGAANGEDPTTKEAGELAGASDGFAASLSAEARCAYVWLPACNWPVVMAVIWGAGTSIWIGLLAVRAVRFNRLVRRCRWRRRRGNKRWLPWRRGWICAWPGVRLAEGAISPLLWSVAARPVIVLPRSLVDQLDAAGRRALLAHELAHYYRRDHWMRWLEMSVLAACWWNPVAWWACRQLRIAEEQCCDTWAVWLLDGESRLYGRTLLATIEFLCNARSIAPLGSTGIGRSDSRKRRFEMILDQPFVRRLSVSTWLAVVPLAIVVLCVSLWFNSASGSRQTSPSAAARPRATPPVLSSREGFTNWCRSTA